MAPTWKNTQSLINSATHSLDYRKRQRKLYHCWGGRTTGVRSDQQLLSTPHPHSMAFSSSLLFSTLALLKSFYCLKLPNPLLILQRSGKPLRGIFSVLSSQNLFISYHSTYSLLYILYVFFIPSQVQVYIPSIFWSPPSIPYFSWLAYVSPSKEYLSIPNFSPFSKRIQNAMTGNQLQILDLPPSCCVIMFNSLTSPFFPSRHKESQQQNSSISSEA